ncbi:MAG: sulfotransferase family 2 domain-containing protein [Rhodobacter sp.]|nr:sulfotransferase family 2 domain-containing protein [Rhodobacter sp.]
MTRDAYVLDEHGLVVFWARKAACTSIVEAILFDILGQDKDAFGAGGLRKRPWLNEHGFHYSGKKAARIAKSKGYRSIAMIREPYERLISIFLNAYVLHGGRPVRQFADVAWFAQNFYCQITGENPHRRRFAYRGLSFFEFVTAVCDRLDRHWSHDLRERVVVARTCGRRMAMLPPWPPEPWLNPHWNTQIPARFRDGGFRYDLLYTTDRSDAFFRRLSDLTGCEISAKRLNASRYARPAEAEPVRDLVRENPLSYAEDPMSVNKASYESAELRARVRRSFSVDYHYLGQSDP